MQWVRADKGLPPGIGVLIEPSRLQDSKTADTPYYIVLGGQRFYGATPGDIVATIDTIRPVADTGTAGVGMNIDIGRITNKSDNPYYILINGQRCYGSDPATVLTRARLRENYVEDSQLSGGGIVIDTQKLLKMDPAPYFMGVNGQCIYGDSDESVMDAIGNGDQGTKCPKSGVSAIMLDTQYLSSPDSTISSNSYYIVVNGWRVYGNSPEDVLVRVGGSMQQIQTVANPSMLSKAASATRKAAGAAGRGIGAVAGAAGRGIGAVAGAAGRGLGAAAGATGRGLAAAAGAAGRGLGAAAGATGRGLAAAGRGIGSAAGAAGSAIKGAFTRKAKTGAAAGTAGAAAGTAGVATGTVGSVRAAKAAGTVGLAPAGSARGLGAAARQAPSAIHTRTPYQDQMAQAGANPRRRIAGIPDYSWDDVDNFPRKFPTTVNTAGNRFFDTPYGRHRQIGSDPQFNPTTGLPYIVSKSGKRLNYVANTPEEQYKADMQKGGSRRYRAA